MANYATNLFFASTENGKDLDRVEKFLEETFCDCYLERSEDFIEGEFSSKWDYPEKEIDEMISLLEGKNEIYIRVLTHELCNEYVNFQVFSSGEWSYNNPKKSTGPCFTRKNRQRTLSDALALC